jgi:drug/metabolite transporter (DMT)-like permease
MERPSRRTWILLALGVAGVGVSVTPDLGGAHLGAGLILTAIGMLGLATGTVLQKRWTEELDSRIVVTTQLALAALLLIPITTLAGQWHLRASVDLAWSVGWLAWPLSIGSMILLVHLLRRYTASTTSMLLLLVPAATAVLSLVVLEQRLPPLSLVGMALTIGAVLPVVRQTPASVNRDAAARARPVLG